MIQISRYGSRWAVYLNGQRLAANISRKDALAVRNALHSAFVLATLARTQNQ